MRIKIGGACSIYSRSAYSVVRKVARKEPPEDLDVDSMILGRINRLFYFHYKLSIWHDTNYIKHRVQRFIYCCVSICSWWIKVKVTLRSTVSRPVRHGARRPSGTRGQFFFLLEILFRKLRVCCFVEPSLTSGRVCNLLLLLVLASAVTLGSILSDEGSGLSCVSISL
jgi:hypothetical protein